MPSSPTARYCALALLARLNMAVKAARARILFRCCFMVCSFIYRRDQPAIVVHSCLHRARQNPVRLLHRRDLELAHRICAESGFVTRIFGRHCRARGVRQVNAWAGARHFAERVREIKRPGRTQLDRAVNHVGRCARDFSQGVRLFFRPRRHQRLASICAGREAKNSGNGDCE